MIAVIINKTSRARASDRRRGRCAVHVNVGVGIYLLTGGSGGRRAMAVRFSSVQPMTSASVTSTLCTSPPPPSSAPSPPVGARPPPPGPPPGRGVGAVRGAHGHVRAPGRRARAGPGRGRPGLGPGHRHGGRRVLLPLRARPRRGRP